MVVPVTKFIVPSSFIVIALFWISFPVVESNLAIALSVAEAGQTTSPEPALIVASSKSVSHAFTLITFRALLA